MQGFQPRTITCNHVTGDCEANGCPNLPRNMLYGMNMPQQSIQRNDPRTYVQEVTPFYGFDPNNRGLDNYFVDTDMYAYMKANGSRAVSQMVPSAQLPIIDNYATGAQQNYNVPNALLQNQPVAAPSNYVDNDASNDYQIYVPRAAQQQPVHNKGLQQRLEMEQKLSRGHEARNFPNNLLESRRDGRGLTVINPVTDKMQSQQLVSDGKNVESFFNDDYLPPAEGFNNGFRGGEGFNNGGSIQALTGIAPGASTGAFAQQAAMAANNPYACSSNGAVPCNTELYPAPYSGYSCQDGCKGCFACKGIHNGFNPFVTEDEKIRMVNERKDADRRRKLKALGYEIDDPNNVGCGMNRVNRHSEQVYDNMDLWVDKNVAENQQRYLKFNTREMPMSRVPQHPNSLISPDCNGIPLTRNQPNLNLTNQGALPPHALDRYNCQNVRLENGNTTFVCKKVGQCNTGYSYAGMSIDKDMSEKMKTQVPTRRVERSKLGMPNQVRNVVGTLGKTFKDPGFAQQVFFSRMSDCGNPLPHFDQDGNYVSADRANGVVWGDCNEVFPDTSNLAAYDSNVLFARPPYGIPGTGADLSFGLRTQYARGGLSKESELIRAAQAMNNTGSIMHGNNLYLPIEGELQDTIVNVGK